MENRTLNTIEEALTDLKAGKPIVVVDDLDRENEGDVLVAAQFVTPDIITLMAKEARGLICIAMIGPMLDRLGIPMMVSSTQNGSGMRSPFTVSVEATTGVTTGISAHDRARTVQTLIDPTSAEEDLVSPGHMFPLRAHPQGVLARRGHTEAGIDLTRLAGLIPAAVVCEIMNDDGTMARLPALFAFAEKFDLKLVSIDALVQYRLQHEGQQTVARVDKALLPTRYGRFTVSAYRDSNDLEHLLLCYGDLTSEPPLVRLHSECLTGDVFGSLRCDCGEQLQTAMQRIVQEGQGLILYLRQEGRGIGLANKIKAYALQDRGLDTVDANVCLGFSPDQRDYAVGAAILRDQGISAVRLMTNNPAKVADLEANNIRVVKRIPHQMKTRPENESYLQTKAEKMDHLLAPEINK